MTSILTRSSRGGLGAGRVVAAGALAAGALVLARATAAGECVPACEPAPLTVVEELDGLKSRSDDVGRSARTALRTLEELRVANGGSLADPVPTGTGSATLQIEINNVRKHLLVEHGLEPSVPDNRIIGAALGQADFGPTTMVSNDAALRINPGITIETFPKLYAVERLKNLDSYLDGLRKAGLPE